MDIHELTAAYALDALDADDARAYEAHLDGCERCREELAMLSGAAANLAWANESPAPPARLRASILAEAAAGRENVVPLPVSRTRLFRATAAVGAVVAVAAVVLGIWATSLDHQVNRSAVVVLPGGKGVVAVDSGGKGVLSVRLPMAPAGKTYEAWVIPPGGTAQPAGLFAGGGNATAVVQLGRPVPHGAHVAVTVEPSTGSTAPTTTPLFDVRA